MMELSELEQWFAERPKWLQDASRRLVEKGEFAEQDYQELLSICKGEAVRQAVTFQGLAPGALVMHESKTSLRLVSIAGVTGVNALRPSKPLEFGDVPLCIVYGRNGAGKSGYVRLLKHACGARHRGELHGNVFASGAAAPRAELTYELNKEKKTQSWTGSSLPDLRGVDIYDTAGGLVYVNDENEVTFEPWLLRLFTQLTQACEEISRRLREQVGGMVSAKPQMPPELQSTPSAAWYAALEGSTTVTSVDKATSWTAEDELALTEKNKRLAEADPAARAAALRRERTLLLQLHADLTRHLAEVSDERCRDYLRLRNDAQTKRQAAQTDAERVFAQAPLEGVGSESWKLLWEAAKKYSVEHAYPGIGFPNTSAGARCVLCQTELDESGRGRLKSFEAFVKGELQRSASGAEEALENAATLFRDQPDLRAVTLTAEAAGIKDQPTRQAILAFADAIVRRKETTLSADSVQGIAAAPGRDCLTTVECLASKVEREAVQADQDAKGQNRAQLQLDSRELSARKWLHEQKASVQREIERLAAVERLNAADGLTNTTALSRRKSILAEELITKAYVERFREEVERFRAQPLRVSLKKTRTAVGKVYHKLYLEDARTDVKTSEVLSEGEFRIISLAAFLADTQGGGTLAPFIFDDPISSLDHIYEEETARRLVSLSRSRQVVVFTHRLSLVGLLEKYAAKDHTSTKIICLSQHVIGEIADLPINLKRTDSAVNTLLNERLAKVRKAASEGDEVYHRESTALCHDIRVLVERVVECDLLNDVVKRFCQEVNTKGKIHALSRIKESDCDLIDDFMTRYSTFEHSQPEETPTAPPTVQEFEADLKKLSAFIAELKRRNG